MKELHWRIAAACCGCAVVGKHCSSNVRGLYLLRPRFVSHSPGLRLPTVCALYIHAWAVGAFYVTLCDFFGWPATLCSALGFLCDRSTAIAG